MSKKSKGGKAPGKAGLSASPKKKQEPLERIFQYELDKDTILTMKISRLIAPVGGKGPRPKKDELLLMLFASLAALLNGKTPTPPKKTGLVLSAEAAGVGGAGSKPRVINP